MKEKIYYGQHEEEKIINKYLNKDPNKEKGIYVDIGACDPLLLSNTYYYYKRGWKGLEVDSFPGVLEKFKEIRPRDIFLRAAVTDYIGEATMYGRAIENSLIGEDYKVKYGESFKIGCLTMDAIIAQYPEFKEPDFMNMDIETNEEKALSKCNFKTFKPRLICIEYPYAKIIEVKGKRTLKTQDQRLLWEKYLLPFYDFKEIYQNNAFYCRKEKK